MYTVKLTYFKPSGKYYAEGEFKVELGYQMHHIWHMVEEMEFYRKLPGLVEDFKGEYTTLVEVPGHPDEHPRLINPSRRIREYRYD